MLVLSIIIFSLCFFDKLIISFVSFFEASIKISIESVGNLIKNSIDKKKLEAVYTEGLEQAKTTLKQTKI